jgi:hypothetical protein
VKHARFPSLFKGRPPADRNDPAIDDEALLRSLAAGQPVWRIAAHHHTTEDAITRAIGAAVTRGALDDTVFGTDVSDADRRKGPRD